MCCSAVIRPAIDCFLGLVIGFARVSVYADASRPPAWRQMGIGALDPRKDVRGNGCPMSDFASAWAVVLCALNARE
jgi:hypothetical protein